MPPKSLLIPLAVTAFLAAPAAFAQGLQNWITNEANKITQDANSGAISPGQETNLQNRQAQIQAQQQQWAAQNGGYLTPQQQAQIGSEMRSLNQHVNGDVRRDANAGSAGMYPNGWTPPANGMPPANWTPQPGWNQNAASPAYAQQNANGQYRHHHRHDGNYNGNYSGNYNGYNGNGGPPPNGQYWH